MAAAGATAAADFGVNGSGAAGGAVAVLRLLGCDESQPLARWPSLAAAYLTRSGTAAGVNGGGASGSGLALRGGVRAGRAVRPSDLATARAPASAAGRPLDLAFCNEAALRPADGPPAGYVLSLLPTLLPAEHAYAISFASQRHTSHMARHPTAPHSQFQQVKVLQTSLTG
jgi:hypothetical protein